jgi:hypothetical protein
MPLLFNSRALALPETQYKHKTRGREASATARQQFIMTTIFKECAQMGF